MKPENAIEVKEVTKKFRIYSDKGHTLKEKTLFRKRRKYEERSVLDGISFEVKKGEAVGLIGHNGCGKSTTLKLLTKIMYPDQGTICMEGRVSSLIELGAGFHPDMSGRENIYINASIFGLTKKEIDERLNEMIAFSELQESIDHPVRTYSSGMYMRLAFSVAINVDADILLIDEILAVGDAGFQSKCLNRLKEIKANGTTIVIVSHSMGQIEQICDRSIWIHQGKIAAQGRAQDVDLQYLDYMGRQRQAVSEEVQHTQKKGRGEEASPDQKKSRWGNGKVQITAVHLLDAEGKEHASLVTGEPLCIKIDYTVKETVQDAVFGIGIFRVDGIQCYGTNTRIDKLETFDIKQDGSVCFYMDVMALLSGSYLLDAAIECGMGIPVDYCKGIRRFEVFSKADDVGVVRLQHWWDIDTIRRTADV